MLTDNGFNVDALVREVRQKTHASIVRQCGIMRVLGMSHPIELQDVYTSVNILQISGCRRVGIADLVKIYASDEFEHPGVSRVFEQQMPGLEAVKQYSKLMILGKPGAGKTTFLKYVALQCILGNFQANRVPIFMTLKEFSETEQQPSLLEYIARKLAVCGVASERTLKQLLSLGRVFVLLDGLDEVKEKDVERVVREVGIFSTQFLANSFVITYNFAASEYTFEQFAEVRIADFTDEQIEIFAAKWFAAKDPIKSKNFIAKLKKNRLIRELATCPLLLTLLCLVFEESADFPFNRSELYEEGLDILLKKWDAKRNVERDQVYKELSVQHKKYLLSHIALIAFQQGDYFFRQQELEQHIANYIQHLITAKTETSALQLDSKAVLKAIEAQHGLLVERAMGIYSFSHLSFQEYFAAKEIVTSSNPQALETALKHLATRITEKRWREVILLTTSMLSNADYLLQLIKQQIDYLVFEDKYVQKFLTWLSQKARAVSVTHKIVAVRAFYLDLILGLDLELNPALSLTLKLEPTLDFALKRDLDLDLELDFTLNLACTLDCTLARTPLVCNLDRAIGLSIDRELQRSLQHLKEQLPNPDASEESFKKWWRTGGKAWTEQLRAVQIKYRDIGYDWQFSRQQKQALKQYYDATKLLVDCIKSSCYMTQAVREELEETLLLPIVEIEV